MPQAATLLSLRQHELFSGLSDEELREILRWSRQSRVSARGCLHVQANGGALCVLVSGLLKLTRPRPDGREILLDLVHAPDVFGELSVSDDEPVDIFAEALEPSQVCAVPWSFLTQLAQARPALVLELARWTDQRRRRLEHLLENHQLPTVAARLAHLLLQLAEQHGLPGIDGVLLPMRLRQQDMASLIGASREFVSTTLTSFRRRGWIHLERRRVVILDPRALARLLDGTPG